MTSDPTPQPNASVSTPDTSAANRDIIRRVYELAAAGELAGLAPLMAQDHRLTQAPGHPVPGSWVGAEANAAAQRVFETCGTRDITVHEIIADGPHRVIGLVDAHGIDHQGQPWTMPVAECFWIEDGRVTDIRPFYWDLVRLRQIAAPPGLVRSTAASTVD